MEIDVMSGNALSENRINEELLRILVCPKSHGPLEQRGDWLYCEESGLRYPIRDGIPVMLIDQAEPIPNAESDSVAGE